MTLKCDGGYMKLKPPVSQKPQPHIAFAPSIRITQKGFDLNLQGMHHIAATLIWERMYSFLNSQSQKNWHSPSQLLSSNQPLFALLAEFSSRAILSRRDRPLKKKVCNKHIAEGTAAYFHRLLPFTFSTAFQKIPRDHAW